MPYPSGPCSSEGEVDGVRIQIFFLSARYHAVSRHHFRMVGRTWVLWQLWVDQNKSGGGRWEAVCLSCCAFFFSCSSLFSPAAPPPFLRRISTIGQNRKKMKNEYLAPRFEYIRTTSHVSLCHLCQLPINSTSSTAAQQAAR